MSSVTEIKPTASRLSATDPNLAFLASRASIELDRLSKGKDGTLEAVAQLAKLLGESTKLVVGRKEPATFWDPTTVTMVHSALRAGGSTPATMDELIQQATEIAARLAAPEAATAELVTDRINRLRLFCIGLVDSALAQEQSQMEGDLEAASWS
jgi:hypothetical protein